MRARRTRTPLRRRTTTKIVGQGHRGGAAAPFTPVRNAFDPAFLSWMTDFTARVVKAAREEERLAILALVPPSAEPAESDAWYHGYDAALRIVRAAILRRCDAHAAGS